MGGFAEKLTVQNCGNSAGNSVHYMYGMSGFVEKIEYPELRKFNGKLYTLYIYGMVGFVEKLNVQNCVNSTENCVHYFCTKCLDW